MKIKQILIIILALVVSAFLGYRFGIAQIGSLKSVVEPGSMATEASYVVFTDGSTIYARNGDTGEIEFSGTDAATVINDVLTNGLTPGRNWKEKVVLKGKFTLTGFLDVPDYTDLEIQGELVAGADLPYMIRTSRLGTGTSNQYIHIHGGRISAERGTYTVTDAMKLQIWRGSVYDIEIRNVAGNGITCYSHAIDAKCMEMWIHNILMDGIDNNGIVFTRWSADNEISDLILRGNSATAATAIYIDRAGGQTISDIHPYGWHRGLWIKDSSLITGTNLYFDTIGYEAIRIDATGGLNVAGHTYTNVHLLGPGMAADGTYDAITLNGSVSYVRAVEFTNVWAIQFNSTRRYRYGFSEVGSVAENSLTNAHFDEHHPNGGAVNIISAKLRNVVDGTGKVSENSEVASVQNGSWVAHGLISTPSNVQITPSAKRITAVFPNANDTHFQVGLWDETGTAITTPETISWYAEV